MSAIIARFSSSVVRNTSVTCRRQLLPKIVQTGVSASSSARVPASFSTGEFARRVLPNAATLACLSFSRRMAWKNSMSLGFEAA